MRIAEIREIARNHQVNAGHLTKADLIKAIQRKEGNFDCFATAANGNCDQADCLWRGDCLSANGRH